MEYFKKKAIECYFCKEIIKEEPKVGVSYYCNDCAKNHDLLHVITSVTNDVIKYAHIYIGQEGYTYKYHIRLDLLLNTTHIFGGYKADLNGNHAIITILPGFPLNPSNVHKKLKTYIIFS